MESHRKLPHLFIPSKTATLVPEVAVKDLPLAELQALVPALAVKTCSWAEHSDYDDYGVEYSIKI